MCVRAVDAERCAASAGAQRPQAAPVAVSCALRSVERCSTRTTETTTSSEFILFQLHRFLILILIVPNVSMTMSLILSHLTPKLIRYTCVYFARARGKANDVLPPDDGATGRCTAAVPQGCAMDAGARPEPRAFGARLGGPGQAHLPIGLGGSLYANKSASQLVHVCRAR